MGWIQLPDLSVEICTALVTRADYLKFVRAIHGDAPPGHGGSAAPVTGVSAAQAEAFARWLSQIEGRPYRLPTLEEMEALAAQAQGQAGPVWACQSRKEHGVRQRAQACLTEWLACASDLNTGHLRCITAPAWLLEERSTRSRGAISDDGHSFVTFRLARETHYRRTRAGEMKDND